MDNKDFDEIFSSKLQETQSFEFRESDWEEVSERLKEPKRKKRGGIWFWMLGAACLVLGLTTAYLAIDLNDTKQELAKIQKSIVLNPTENLTSISDENTSEIIERTTQVIQQTTIAKTKIKEGQNSAKRINRTIENNSPTKTSNNISSINTNTPIKTAPKKTEFATATKKSIIETATEVVANKIVTVSEITTAISLSMFPLEAREKEINFKPTLVNSTIPKTKKESKQKHRLGLTAAWSLPEKLVDQDISENSSLKRNAYDVGLHYSYDVTKRISTWASVTFHSTNYKTKNLDSAAKASLLQEGNLVVEYGDLEPGAQPLLSSEDEKLNITKNVLRYSLGANYTLLQKPRWSLYTGLSAHAQTKLRNKIFIDESDDASNFEEERIELKANGKKEAFRFHALAAQVAYRFDLTNRLSWQVEAWSQLKLAPKSSRIYEPFGLRTIVSYNF